jgi:hypothetical protein
MGRLRRQTSKIHSDSDVRGGSVDPVRGGGESAHIGKPG